MKIFPRECYLHSDASCVYDVISWDPSTKLYRLRNDAGVTIDVDHTRFTLISDASEPLLEPTANGDIVSVANLHEQGIEFEFTSSREALGGPPSHAPGDRATRTGATASGSRRPSGGAPAKAGSPEAEAAKAKVKELLSGCTSREELAAVAEPVLGEPAAELVEKYSHLDNGRFRMTIGNRMRGILSRGGK